MGHIISTVNMKGGVGKTTLTVNLGAALAKYHGQKVLVVDLDSQISATLSLLAPQNFARLRKKRLTLSTLLDQIINPNSDQSLSVTEIITDNICQIPNFSLLPGDLDLYDEYLVSETLHQQALSQSQQDFQLVWNHFERVLLAKILAPIQSQYDFILLDCAPGYNLLTRSGIAASHFYLLPARPEPLSVVGIQLLERRINKLKQSHQDHNPLDLKLLGIVFILSGGPLLARYYRQVMRRVKDDFSPHHLFESWIPMDVNVAKALDTFSPAVIASPNSSGSKALVKLTEEFLAKIRDPH